ncbi:hypothetical protein ACFVGM_09310 [Kitasatospora purpeofusca]|uniref:hypothetical protein n=1 Tax=Kitasatospora purpeofusca TaxID=67352 RepID=UPI00368C7ECE
MARFIYLSQYYGGAAGAPDPERVEEILAHPSARKIAAILLAGFAPVVDQPQIIPSTFAARPPGNGPQERQSPGR